MVGGVDRGCGWGCAPPTRHQLHTGPQGYLWALLPTETALNPSETSETRELSRAICVLSACYLCAICVLSEDRAILR